MVENAIADCVVVAYPEPRDVSLLLNVVQSVNVRQPLTDPVAEVQSNAPAIPPTNEPSVPEYVIGAVTVGVEVAVTFNVPLLPAV